MENSADLEAGGMKENGETGSTLKADIGDHSSGRFRNKKCFIILAVAALVLVIISIIVYFSWSQLSSNHNLITETVATPPIEVCHTEECNATATILRENMDEMVHPCDNFVKFACGNFNRHPYAVPNTDSTDGIVNRRMQEQLQEDLTAVNKDDPESVQQLRKLYESCAQFDIINHDEDEDEKIIISLFETIFQTGFSISKVLALIHRETSLMLIFDVSIQPNDEIATTNEIHISPAKSPWKLRKSDILNNTDHFQDYKQSVNDTLYKYRFLLRGLSRQDLRNMTADVVEIDKELIKASSGNESQGSEGGGSYIELSGLNEIFGNHSVFNWVEYFQTLFSDLPNIQINQDSVVYVADKQFVEKLIPIFEYTSERIAQIKQHLYTRILHSLRNHVFDSELIYSENKDSCFKLVKQQMPFALTHKLIKENHSDETMAEVKEMLSFITTAFKNDINGSTWLDEESKLRAIGKVDNMMFYLGYPDWLPNSSAVDRYYEGLQFGSSLFDNELQLKKLEFQRKLKELNQPNSVDKKWLEKGLFLAHRDAFNYRFTNEIVVLAGEIQKPFVGMGLRAIDFGTLGFTIGHEIGHGFDDAGITRDETGKANAWMSEYATEKFKTQTDCFVNQYQDYWRPKLESFLDPKNVIHGKRTLGENIADNLGVRAAFEGYQLYVKVRGRPEPRLSGLEEYTPDQIFFLAQAQAWCSSMDQSDTKGTILEDEHSPKGLRILGPLSNNKEFSRVWQCSSSSRMNPERKCDLWGEYFD